jgi:hypothetical protein
MSVTVITVDLMSVTVNTPEGYTERARVTPTVVRYSTWWLTKEHAEEAARSPVSWLG